MSPKEREIRQKLKSDFIHYASRCLKIRTKAGKIEQFELNDSQLYIHQRVEEQRAKTGRVRAIILKGRQQGCSTYVEGRFYWRVSHTRGIQAFILTHEEDATNNLFALANRYHENCPSPVKPSTSAANAKELHFDKLDSGYKVGTAGNKAVGRSSTVQLFHGCLSPDTSIIDCNGSLKPMRDFIVGDMVRTHTGALAPISFISEQRKYASKLTLKGLGSLPLVATEEHRFLTKSGWQELGNLSVGDSLLFPVYKIHHDAISWPFRLPDIARPQGGGTRNSGPDNVAPNYEIGRVLGLYLAEGCIIKQRKSGAHAAVTFAIHERETERTEKWLDCVSHLFASRKTAIRKDSKTVTVTVYGKSFASFVHHLCGELDSKRIPFKWKSCGEDFVRGLVHGYLAGDGHSSKNDNDRRISAPSIRSAITIGMRDCLASLGYGWACISYRAGAIRNNRNERAQWTLRLCGDGVDRLCNEIGWSMPDRKRSGNYGSVAIIDGYAHVPVIAIDDVGEVDVMDFEIAHADHSYCTVHSATHNSEVGFWPNAQQHAAGIIQAIPDEPDTEAFLESTANGIGNYFHQQWQAAEAGLSEYIAIFVPWFWQKEYCKDAPDGFELTEDENKYRDAYALTMEQMAWRRSKIIELKDETLFKQEYPATAAEAFQVSGLDPYIKPEMVMIARKAIAEEYGPKLLGVDPARFGDDRTSICFRQGRKVHWIRSYSKKDTMQVAGLVKLAIEEVGADQCAVDVGGLGAGVYDRLIEIVDKSKCKVVSVNSASSPLDAEKYTNKRAEMWGEIKLWIAGQPAQLIDSDELHADLTQIRYSYDSNSALVMEKKEAMKKRGLRSPDMADSLGLTFAEPFLSAPKQRRPIGQNNRSLGWMGG
jgi:hypothetical protein